MIKPLLALVFFMLAQQTSAQEIGTFTDERNGQKYKTVSYTIKKKRKRKPSRVVTWMAENLNTEVEGSFCRDDNPENCATYGRLYTWPAAMKACPAGWHLPDNDDWQQLVDQYGGMTKAGQHLKSDSDLWARNGKGTNKSGFNAMPYGTGTSHTGFHQYGLNAIFWSADQVDETSAWDWLLVTGWKKIMRSDGDKLNTGNSVRCVKD